MKNAEADSTKRPFMDHVRELQIMLTWCAVAIGLGGLAAYSVHSQLLELIRRPLGQALYYTSPVGGFNFVFKLCLVAGIIAALPVILYQVFCFAGPLLRRTSKRTVIWYVAWSFILAVAGVLFGYLVSLPAALHFLTTFGGSNIQSLIRADEYFSFALAYVAGFALIFQVPLIMLFINRIKPMRPGRMMKIQRYVILASFIFAAILTPTPDPINQAIMALPIIMLYQLSVFLVWAVNLKTRRTAKKAAGELQAASKVAPASGKPDVIPQATAAYSLANASHLPVKMDSAPSRVRPIMDISPGHRYAKTAAQQILPAAEPNRINRRPPVGHPRLIDMLVQ